MGYADEERKVIFATSLQAMQCRQCGGVYALGSQFLEHKQEYGGSWVCPYCRTTWSYTESDLEKERKEKQRQLMRAETLLHERNDARNQARAQKAAKTRIKSRIANGVCPRCNRHFTDLQKHMASKHPGYGGDKD